MIKSILDRNFPWYIDCLNKFNVPQDVFISAISTNSGRLSDKLKLSNNYSVKIIKDIFPDKSKGRSVYNYILLSDDLKSCNKCCSIKPISEFRLNSINSDGLQNHCKICQSKSTKTTQPHRQAAYRASINQRIVEWTELEEIAKFYLSCPDGYHVDHIIPLNGTLVSGLHVLNNLQYLPALDNIKKSNKFNGA
jgi:hypothetical protein